MGLGRGVISRDPRLAPARIPLSKVLRLNPLFSVTMTVGGGGVLSKRCVLCPGKAQVHCRTSFVLCKVCMGGLENFPVYRELPGQQLSPAGNLGGLRACSSS